MTLTQIGELTCSIGVTDMTASIAWYEKILGLTLLYRADDIGWCELSSSVAKVNVGLSQIETVPQGGGATLVWGVEDILEAKAMLDAHGVNQDGEIRHIPGLVKLLTFYDPDGNTHMFSKSEQG